MSRSNSSTSSFYERQVFGDHENDDAQIHRLQAEMAVGQVRPGASLLVDIGSGAGIGGRIIGDRLGITSRVCMDLSAEALAVAAASGGLPLIASAEGHRLPFAAESVDVVILDEVIEHLVDPDSILEEIRRTLRKDGLLLLSTPNLAAWFNRLLLFGGIQPAFSEVSLRGVFGRPGTDIVGHLRLFTRRALVGLLEARGFELVAVRGTTFPGLPKPAHPVDRLLTRVPSLAAGLVVSARPA